MIAPITNLHNTPSRFLLSKPRKSDILLVKPRIRIANMSLAYGRDILSIPGPSIIPDRVLQAMHRPAPNIYEGDLIDLTARIKTDLQAVARTKGEALIYIANGHGGWEAALSNIVNRGDKLLALSTGRFTKGWIEIAKPMGAVVDEIDFGTNAPIDPQKVEDALRADKNHEIKAVITVQTDTASSIKNDIPALRKAMNAANDDSARPRLQSYLRKSVGGPSTL